MIECKWVFAVKRNENEKVQRYKARLVAQGYRQTAGVDYTETYDPVVSTSSISVFLSMCVQLEYKIHQYDVDTAFFNGHLEEDAYMWPPPGLKTEPGQVCKLTESLWNEASIRSMVHDHFKRFSGSQVSAVQIRRMHLRPP